MSQMYITAWSVIEKRKTETTQYLSTGRMSKLWYRHPMQYYTVVKKMNKPSTRTNLTYNVEQEKQVVKNIHII